MAAPKRNSSYGEREYWESRFETEECFEWLSSSLDEVVQMIAEYVQTHHRILHIGCGTSALSDRLYLLGHAHIINVDYSQVLIDRMKKEKPEFTWICADMGNMAMVEDSSVDVVIEKATLDSLLTAENDPWHRSDQLISQIDRVLSEINRVLTPSGVFISITFEQPHFRVPLYARHVFNWSVTVAPPIGDQMSAFMYCMHKGRPLDMTHLNPFLYATRNSNSSVNTAVKPVAFNDSNDFLLAIDL